MSAYCDGEVINQEHLSSWVKAALEDGGQAVDVTKLQLAALVEVAAPQPYRISYIGPASGVNLLQGNTPLAFPASQLCVVYGHNGAGKSGYVRILKAMSGKMPPKLLLGSVFEKSKGAQSCPVGVESSGNIELEWSPTTGPLEELRSLQLFDRNVALLYRNSEQPLGYEPPVLKLFEFMIDASTDLTSEIDRQRGGLVSSLPALPGSLASTQAATFVGGLGRQITNGQIDSACCWSNSDSVSLADKRITLANLSNEKYRKQLTAKLTICSNLKKVAADLSAAFGPLGQSAVKQLRASAVDLTTAISASGSAVISCAELPVVGVNEWRYMWEAARAYAVASTGGPLTFPPPESADCPLCQQKIGPMAAQRLATFEEFVQQDLAKQLQLAQKELNRLCDSAPMIPSDEDFLPQLVDVGIDEAGVAVAETFLAQARAINDSLFSPGVAKREPAELPLEGAWTQSLDAIEAKLKADRGIVDDPKVADRVVALEKEVAELEGRKWLGENKTEIVKEVARRRRLASLETARGLANTAEISIFKGQLVKKLQTQQTDSRFKNELAKFRKQKPPVEITLARTQKGVALHRLNIIGAYSGAGLDDVLSEGEQQISALAAFLSEAESTGTKAPFIFDDPIASLDHIFEENVAARLAEIAKDRQVIVFTHRLEFASLLQTYAKKQGYDAKLTALQRTDNAAGIPTEYPFQGLEPAGRVNKLIDEGVPKLRKSVANQDLQEAEERTGAICSHIRKTLEAIVEQVLVNGIVRRHSREIQTKNKIFSLVKVSQDDCRFIDDLMTKYSADLHDQPLGSPYVPPGGDELEADLIAIREWLREFKGRPDFAL